MRELETIGEVHKGVFHAGGSGCGWHVVHAALFEDQCEARPAGASRAVDREQQRERVSTRAGRNRRSFGGAAVRHAFLHIIGHTGGKLDGDQIDGLQSLVGYSEQLLHQQQRESCDSPIKPVRQHGACSVDGWETYIDACCRRDG